MKRLLILTPDELAQLQRGEDVKAEPGAAGWISGTFYLRCEPAPLSPAASTPTEDART